MAAGALFLAMPVQAAAVTADPPGISPTLVTAAERSGLRRHVLELAFRAHTRAVEQQLTSSDLLTVIDYSLLSRTPRLWVLDLGRKQVLAHELVAHGSSSGGDLARRFSNIPKSNQSSLGTFITGPTYRGKHGTSLRLRGIDSTLNDRAESRAIVMHGAHYVSLETVKHLGRLGRSQGCPALSHEAARRVIQLIRDGTVLYAYYPVPELDAV